VIPASVNELVLSLKVSGDISLGGEWQLKGSVFGTGLPVWANPRGSDLYFFGASLGLSRSLPLLKNPWSLKLMLGGYYTTTFTTGVYGYTT